MLTVQSGWQPDSAGETPAWSSPPNGVEPRVEPRGFEPLTSWLQTRFISVDRGRCGWSVADGGLCGTVQGGDVAAPVAAHDPSPVRARAQTAQEPPSTGHYRPGVHGGGLLPASLVSLRSGAGPVDEDFLGWGSKVAGQGGAITDPSRRLCVFCRCSRYGQVP
jgi:hypothetical protein